MDAAEDEAAPIEQMTDEADPIEEAAPMMDGDARTHTVAAGDTLWDISETYLGDGNLWPSIAEANPSINPHRLHIGAELTIPAN